MARSGKYLYYKNDTTTGCVPLYNSTECFSCMNSYVSCLSVAYGTATYYIPYSSVSAISSSGASKLRINDYYLPENNFCWEGVSICPGYCNLYNTEYSLCWCNEGKWCDLNRNSNIMAEAYGCKECSNRGNDSSPIWTFRDEYGPDFYYSYAVSSSSDNGGSHKCLTGEEVWVSPVSSGSVFASLTVYPRSLRCTGSIYVCVCAYGRLSTGAYSCEATHAYVKLTCIYLRKSYWCSKITCNY